MSFFDDNTATLTFIAPGYSAIPSSVTANGKTNILLFVGLLAVSTVGIFATTKL